MDRKELHELKTGEEMQRMPLSNLWFISFSLTNNPGDILGTGCELAVQLKQTLKFSHVL